ncbi:MAG: hypothetical protein NUV60_02715 [Patescibacteria group bacterium]|nr:hypothetical protein [Patescibacteria group bacterium]
MSEGAPKNPAVEAAERQREMQEELDAREADTKSAEVPQVEAVPETPAVEDPVEAPKVETPVEAPRAAPTSEVGAPTESVGEAPRGSAEHTRALLSLQNKGFFNKMSEGGKEIANEAYEGIRAIPSEAGRGVTRIFGKMGIAYNQFWINRHERKAAQMRGEMGTFDMQTEALDQSKKEMESIIANLKAENIPGAAESLQVKLKDIDRQKADILNKKDKVQSKFEARDNKVKLYTNERDQIADKLIGRYAEKLAPMEKKMESLETCRDEADLLVAVTEAQHQDRLLKLGSIEKRKGTIEEAMRRIGEPEREIKKTVKPLDDLLFKGREDMRKEKEILAKEKSAIDKKIAKLDAKANPYRDRREEFVRVKEGRPVDMEVEARTRARAFEGREEPRAHPRGEAPEEATPAPETAPSEPAVETAEADENRMETSAFVSGWNEFIEKQPGKDIPVLDQKDFLKATKLPENFKMDVKSFRSILERYYKLKKLPKGRFATAFATFVQEK